MPRELIAGAILLAACAPGIAHAQAWPQPPGKHYASLRASYLDTDTEFNYQGDEQPLYAEDPTRSNASYREIAVDGYVEYGIVRLFTLVTSLTYKNARTYEDIRLIAGYPPQEAIRTNYGFSDLWLSLRTPLVQRRVVVSAQYGIKVPLGYDATPENGGPPLGTGEVDGDFGAYAGAGAGSIYGSLGGSYRVRGGDFNDEWWFNAELGGTWSRVFAKLRLEGVQNTEEPVDIYGQTVETPVPDVVVNQVIVGNGDATKLLAVVDVAVAAAWSLTAEAWHVLAGKNTLAGTTFALGVVHQSR